MANNTKQQAINTFTGGLNTDLHPLTTPNDILTDCINGTVITYNGNEYILQNDMGNYQLKKAQLPTDYIPVGIKEYGNIIYIVSYNPIDKKCQIGSYPSPQTLFDNTPKPSKNSKYHGIQINSLSDNWRWNENATAINPGNLTNVLFTQYSPNQNLIVLFPEEGDIKNTFLSPGDKYWLYISNKDEKNTWKFQKTEYYSLTESKEVYKIEDSVEEQPTNIINDAIMPYVSWEIPGWLSYKPSLLNLDSFNIYLTDITLPAFLTQKDGTEGILTFDVQGQITISTDLAWRSYFPKLKVLFEYRSDRSDSEWTYLGEGRVQNQESLDGKEATNYGNKIDVLTYNTSSGDLHVSNSDKIITIRATPYIVEDGYGIVYDNFKVEYSINLSDLYSIKEINTFSTYKYLIAENDITINFSISSPTVNINTLDCKYRLWSLQNIDGVIQQGQIVTNALDTDNDGFAKIVSLTFLGQNIINITFDDNFSKENIYIFELGIFDKVSNKHLQSFKQFLITSELMNSFYSIKDTFQDIFCNEWISKAPTYQKLVGVPNVEVAKINNNGFFGSSSKTNIPSAIVVSNEAKAIEQMPTELSSTYYTGYISKQELTFKHILSDPTIFNNKQDTIWEEVKFRTTIKGELRYIVDNTTKIKPISDVVFEPEDKKLYNSEVTHFNSNYYIYIPMPIDGRDGTRRYLYNNLFVNSSNKSPKGVVDSNNKPITIQKYTVPKDRAILINSWTDRKDGRIVIDYIDGVYKGDVVKGTESYFGQDLSLSCGGHATENINTVDAKIADFVVDKPSLFIPVIFHTCGGGNTNKGFYTPDSRFSEDHSGYGDSIAILCKQGSKISAAVVKFYNDSNEQGCYRYTGNDRKYSAYFTSRDFSEPYQNENKILQVLFRICLHLYKIENITEVISKNFLKNQNLQEIYKTENSYILNYTRTDQLQKVSYLGYNLADYETRIINIPDLNITNNLTSEANANLKIITTKQQFNYSADSLDVDGSIVTSYNNKIESKTNNAIEQYSATMNYDNTKIYSDFTGNRTIQEFLNNFAAKLVISNGNIYYNDMPSGGIGGTYGSNKHKGNATVRAIDFSTSLPMGDLINSIEELNIVTDEFKEAMTK